MGFEDCTHIPQPCSDICSCVGVNYVTLDLLPGEEQSQGSALPCRRCRQMWLLGQHIPLHGESPQGSG